LLACSLACLLPPPTATGLVKPRLRAMPLPKRFLCLVESGAAALAFDEAVGMARVLLCQAGYVSR
jgi:hypothetical protein